MYVRWEDPQIAGVDEIMDELELLLEPVYDLTASKRQLPSNISI